MVFEHIYFLIKGQTVYFNFRELFIMDKSCSESKLSSGFSFPSISESVEDPGNYLLKWLHPGSYLHNTILDQQYALKSTLNRGLELNPLFAKFKLPEVFSSNLREFKKL